MITGEILLLAVAALIILSIGYYLGRAAVRHDFQRQIKAANAMHEDEVDDILIDKMQQIAERDVKIHELNAEVFRLRGDLAGTGHS